MNICLVLIAPVTRLVLSNPAHEAGVFQEVRYLDAVAFPREALQMAIGQTLYSFFLGDLKHGSLFYLGL